MNSLLECSWCFTVAIGLQTTTTAVTVFYVELNPDLFLSLSDKLILITKQGYKLLTLGSEEHFPTAFLLSTNTE